MNPFKENLTRQGFFAWALIVIVLGYLQYLILLQYDKSHTGHPHWLEVLTGLLWLPLYILIMVRRLQNMGWSPLLAIIGFVPLAAFVLWGLLFAAPPRKKSTS